MKVKQISQKLRDKNLQKSQIALWKKGKPGKAVKKKINKNVDWKQKVWRWWVSKILRSRRVAASSRTTVCLFLCEIADKRKCWGRTFDKTFHGLNVLRTCYASIHESLNGKWCGRWLVCKYAIIISERSDDDEFCPEDVKSDKKISNWMRHVRSPLVRHSLSS